MNKGDMAMAIIMANATFHEIREQCSVVTEADAEGAAATLGRIERMIDEFWQRLDKLEQEQPAVSEGEGE